MAKPDLTKNEEGHRFGTFGGVFTPSILTTSFSIAAITAQTCVRKVAVRISGKVDTEELTLARSKYA